MQCEQDGRSDEELELWSSSQQAMSVVHSCSLSSNCVHAVNYPLLYTEITTQASWHTR